MSYTKAFCSALFLFVAIITHVHAEEPVTVQPPAFVKDIKSKADLEKLTPEQLVQLKAYFVAHASTTPSVIATVNVQDATLIKQDGNALSLAFNLSNREGVQTGVKYSVSLVRETTNGKLYMDTYVYPEVLTLLQNSSIRKEVTYTAPSGLSGEYHVIIESKTSGGLPLGIADIGTVVLAPVMKGIEILTDSCFLNVQNEAKLPKYTLSQGVDIDATEALVLSCMVANYSSVERSVSPKFETHFRTVYGDVVPQEGGTTDPITFKANESRAVLFTLPKAVSPQAYDVQFVLSDSVEKSNTVTAHYVLVGPSATIQNVILDKDTYRAGETAKVSFFLTPSADSFPNSRHQAHSHTTTTLSMSIQNGTIDCIEPHTIQVLPSNIQQTFSYPITTACAHPVLSVTIKDSNGGVLDSRTLTISELVVPVAVPVVEETGIWTLRFLIILMTTMSAFILLYVLIKVRATMRGEVILKSLILTFIFTASCLSGVGEARADTFMIYSSLYGGSAVSFVVNINKSVYSPNETIVATGADAIPACTNGYFLLSNNTLDSVINGSTQNVLNTSSYTPAQSAAGSYVAVFSALNIWFCDSWIDPYCSLASSLGGASYGIPYSVINSCNVNNGATCQSSANSCGQSNSGTIQCNGSCSAGIPANPSGLGTSCQSSANVCGLVNTGTIQCNGSCSATTPSNASCPSTAVNGSCGSSQGTTVSAQPSANICLAGTPAWTDTIASDGTYNWDCAGANGGTNASCSATKSSIPAPTLTLSASPTTIATGNSSNLTWTIGGTADSCWALGGWTGWKTFSGTDTETVYPSVTTSYSLECWNQGVSSGLKNTTVTVTPALSCPAGITKNWTVGTNSCTGITAKTNSNTSSAINDNTSPYIGTAFYLCTNGTWAPIPNPGATCAIALDLNVSPKTVESGKTAVITWDVHGQTGCTLTGGGYTFNPYNGTSSTTPPILGRTSFTLKCPLGEKIQTVDIIAKHFER